MKIALVYDCANQTGGAERVLLAIKAIWPSLVFFTSLIDREKTTWPTEFSSIETSFLDKIPLKNKIGQLLIPLMPIAFEQFDFKDFNLVISVSTGPAKAVLNSPDTCHINYCLTPRRDFWESRFSPNPLLSPFLKLIRQYDYQLAQRPDYILTTCQNVAARIEKHYQRSAKIIHPGIDTKKFRPSLEESDDNSFLIVSRLVDYKKIDLAIQTFNHLKKPLKIVGVGSRLNRLKSLAGPTIKFLGSISDKQLVREYQNCLALIMPQEEDWGLTPIEAQACGKPVIAYSRGGALETVINGQTGLFFEKQSVATLAKVVKNFNPKKYSSKTCRQNALNFSLDNFMLSFKTEVEELLVKYRKQFQQ